MSTTASTIPTAPTPASQTPDAPPAKAADPTLRIEAWTDPVIEALGHDPRSLYAERFWLSILGPSTTWLLRRLVRELEQQPEGFLLDCTGAAHDLGLGGNTGRHSVFMRSLDRCCHFGLAQRNRETVYVRRRVPPLTRRQVERLSPTLQDAHAHWEAETKVAAHIGGTAAEQLIARARQLALTLFELGEDAAAVERQLHTWQFHPSIAWNATEWATGRATETQQAAQL